MTEEEKNHPERWEDTFPERITYTTRHPSGEYSADHSIRRLWTRICNTPDRRIADGEQTVASYKKFSQYYLNSQMPKQLTVSFSGLPAGKKLTVQVKAVDSYNNQSVPVSSKSLCFKL
jgi:hypothetical protein